MPRKIFSSEEERRIRERVAQIERETGSEIVPYVVGISDPYPEAPWRGFALFAALGLFVASLLSLGQSWAVGPTVTEVIAVTLLSGLLGAAMGRYVAPVRRWLVGRALLDRRVHQRALQAFLEEEVFATPNRTGVLIFISLFERRLEVLPDKTLAEQLPTEVWKPVVLDVVEGIRQGRPVDGLMRALEECRRIVLEHASGLPPAQDSLSDELRLRPD
ncbi:MAG: hypothetical protein N2561_01150 [Bacteroidetes bacterium]|nr:hypothetical protein [Rhodothermia bacterium]MCS7155766.1 hypothetical protein [Bacteroidota bacterium]MCX7906133.1 hypothetical protein [Bacteroidota bacterium]MDW8138261.1 hypothetical protein [Bacteroidota bacterium]MDW8285945.1 hypothetical protein [Bacteroidota bacterium]